MGPRGNHSRGQSTILSVLATGIGFCVLWHRTDWFRAAAAWLIPVALATLIAEYLNHERLTAAQSGGLATWPAMIYVSATCDLFFIHRFTDMAVPLSPLILPCWACWRTRKIRSFLAMGVTFLTVSILSMIYHAAFDLQQMGAAGLRHCIELADGTVRSVRERRNDVVAAVCAAQAVGEVRGIRIGD